MLGWDIYIHTEFIESRKMEDWKYPKEENLLGNWITGLNGRDWLDDLVKQNKAEYLDSPGYPLRYWVKVKDILPLVENGPPSYKGSLVIGDDYVTPPGWNSKATLHLEKFKALDPERMIVVDAWDES